MFLYGVLTIECRSGMHIWLLGRVCIHLPNRAMHSDAKRDAAARARANPARDVSPTLNPGAENQAGVFGRVGVAIFQKLARLR